MAARFGRHATRRLLIAAGVVAGSCCAGYVGHELASLPDAATWIGQAPASTPLMGLRAEQAGRTQAYTVEWTPLDRISPFLLCGLVRAEDHGFFRHRGFDWGSLKKAATGIFRSGSVTGGSTISQQLAKNLYLGPEQSLVRKLREALLTVELEGTLSKRRILELYVNVIEWGEGIFGIAQASDRYLGLGPSELGAFEASVLVSMVAAPRHAPAGPNLMRMHLVQRNVLEELHAAGLLDEAGLGEGLERSALLFTLLREGLPLGDALDVATGSRAQLLRRAMSAADLGSPEAWVARDCRAQPRSEARAP